MFVGLDDNGLRTPAQIGQFFAQGAHVGLFVFIEDGREGRRGDADNARILLRGEHERRLRHAHGHTRLQHERIAQHQEENEDEQQRQGWCEKKEGPAAERGCAAASPRLPSAHFVENGEDLDAGPLHVVDETVDAGGEIAVGDKGGMATARDADAVSRLS